MPTDRVWPIDHPGIVVETPDGWMAIPLWGCGPDGTTDPWGNDEPGFVAEVVGGFMAVRAKDGCCAAETNPCDVGGGEPEMLLTVTGASGTINWCGLSWVLPGESGVEKSACPGSYIKTRLTGYTTTLTSYISWQAAHNWEIGGPTGLRLIREYHVFFGAGFGNYYRQHLGGPAYGNLDSIDLAVVGKVDNRVPVATPGVPARPVPPNTPVSTYLYQLNLMTGAPFAYYSGYDLPNQFFGSHTDAGITYAWAKGAGW